MYVNFKSKSRNLPGYHGLLKNIGTHEHTRTYNKHTLKIKSQIKITSCLPSTLPGSSGSASAPRSRPRHCPTSRLCGSCPSRARHTDTRPPHGNAGTPSFRGPPTGWRLDVEGPSWLLLAQRRATRNGPKWPLRHCPWTAARCTTGHPYAGGMRASHYAAGWLAAHGTCYGTRAA